MRGLDIAYTYEVDCLNKKSWHHHLNNFDDASFYQTWSFGAIRWGEKKCSHIILKENDIIVSMAQLRIAKIIGLKTGAAYLNWGPLWRLKGHIIEKQHLQNMLRALYIEYVIRRGFMLRILPKIIPENERESVLNIFKEEYYNFSPDPQKTIVVDLSPPMQELRKNLPKGIRHSLNVAERHNLQLMEVVGDKSITVIHNIFNEMQKRKNYTALGKPEQILAVCKDLADSFKQELYICYHDGDAVAVIGWQTLGTCGFPIVASTSNRALKLRAGTLLFWKMIEYYKNNNFITCDLAGVNPKRNPGGYFFKKSLAGTHYVDSEHYIGQFDAYHNIASLLIFKCGILLKDLSRILQSFAYGITMVSKTLCNKKQRD